MKTSYDLYDEMNPSRLIDAAGSARARPAPMSGADLARVLMAPTLVERIVPVQTDRVFPCDDQAVAERDDAVAAERDGVVLAERDDGVVAERDDGVLAERSDVMVAERHDAGVGGRGAATVVTQETAGSKSAAAVMVGVRVDTPDLRGRIPAPRREARAAVGSSTAATDLATGSAGASLDTTMAGAAWTLDDLLRVGEATGGGVAGELAEGPAVVRPETGVDRGEGGAGSIGDADDVPLAGAALCDEALQDGTFEDLIVGGAEVMPGSSGSLRQTIALFVIAALVLTATVAVAIIW